MATPRHVTSGAFVAVAITALAACAPADDSTSGWDEPTSYTATIDYRAYDIDEGTYQIVVVDHVPVEFNRVDNRGSVFATTDPEEAGKFTLRQIVGRYQAALADRESVETLTWDSTNMPSEVDIDWYPEQITDEQAWTITNIEVQVP